MCFGTPLIVFLPLHFTFYTLRITLYTFYSSLITHSLYLKLRFPSLVPYIYTSDKRPRTNQRRNNRSSPMGEIRTKDEPKNSKLQNVRFINIVISFPFLIPCLKTPSEHRETTERRAKRYRALAAKNSALFLRLAP